MKKSEILKGRRELSKISGKGEYLFFTSILISAFALCIFLCLVSHGFFASEQSIFAVTLTIPAAPLDSFSIPLSPIISNGATLIMFVLFMLLLVSPIYQGSIRWSAYLIEEKKSLPITAVLFYFLSPRLYFSAVFLSFRLFLMRFFSLIAFMLTPLIFFSLGVILSSDFYGQTVLGALITIFSLILTVIFYIFYLIFSKRYSAVRYLFALRKTKRVFRASKEITRGKGVWLLFFSLRLYLSLLPAVFLITAPFSLSSYICGSNLSIRYLIDEKKSQKAV